jgi:undecaprenyl-diphosphatase
MLDAILQGLLEGLTEFLPISSTGHLILLGVLLGRVDEASKTLAIVIQLGAVLAVVVAYRQKLGRLLLGAYRKERESLSLLLALFVAFLPAAFVGLLLHRLIKEHLFGPTPVGIALVVGGFLMIGVELARRGRDRARDNDELGEISWARALWIGIAQCFSLWPGASRSMTTIVGGQLSGLGTRAAADFSFLLAIPTLGAATLYDLYKNGAALVATQDGLLSLFVGMLVSFVVALAVIATFLRYLRRFGLMPFGVYRILLGALVLGLPLFFAR